MYKYLGETFKKRMAMITNWRRLKAV